MLSSENQNLLGLWRFFNSHLLLTSVSNPMFSWLLGKYVTKLSRIPPPTQKIGCHKGTSELQRKSPPDISTDNCQMY